MGGAVLTFAFLVILFAIVATILYVLLFSRPHPRVPAQRVVYASASAAAPSATAAGMPTASGGGSAESGAEPAGAERDIMPGAGGDAMGGPGRVTGGSGYG